MFFVLSRVWDKGKDYKSQQGIEPQTSVALPLSPRDFTMSEVYYEVHITHVLYIARISNVNSIMFVNSFLFKDTHLLQ